jgi:hypothetical protein
VAEYGHEVPGGWSRGHAPAEVSWLQSPRVLIQHGFYWVEAGDGKQ